MSKSLFFWTSLVISFLSMGFGHNLYSKNPFCPLALVLLIIGYGLVLLALILLYGIFKEKDSNQKELFGRWFETVGLGIIVGGAIGFRNEIVFAILLVIIGIFVAVLGGSMLYLASRKRDEMQLNILKEISKLQKKK